MTNNVIYTKELAAKANLNLTRFIRTTESDHAATVQHLWVSVAGALSRDDTASVFWILNMLSSVNSIPEDFYTKALTADGILFLTSASTPPRKWSL